MYKGLTISVAMTTYNGSKFIKEQMDSIFDQTVPVDEIVISDDVSTDNTVEILNQYVNRSIHVRINVNSQNIGPAKNFEQNVKACKGDIIFFCDQDDIWFKDKVEKLAECFIDKDVVYAYHDAIVIDGEGNVINQSLNSSWDKLPDNENKEKVLLRSIRRQGFPWGMSTAFRRDLLNEIFPFRFAADEWLMLCAPLFGKFKCIKEPLVYYRRHGNNASGSNGESIISRVKNTSVQNYFDWPKPYVDSYLDYYERFKDRLPEVVKKELEEQIGFRKSLSYAIDCKSKIKAMYRLLRAYNMYYKKYRGNYKQLFLDELNLLFHRIA